MDRYKDTRKASIFGLLGNLFLFIIKIIVGLISNSYAMVADALNSCSDVLASIMTYIGNKISNVKADKDHNLGHGKAEYIYSMLISIMMFILSFNLLKEGIVSLFKVSDFEFNIWLIVVCMVTVLIKYLLYRYTYKISKKYNNLLLEANSIDHRNDTLITLFTLLSIVLSYFKVPYVDSIVGILISLWILYSGINIFRESYDVLMDKTIDNKTKKKVMDIIKKDKRVLKVNHFNATPVGYMYQISFTIFVDGSMSTFDSHDIANGLERQIEKEIPEIYLSVIHVNPVKLDENDVK